MEAIQREISYHTEPIIAFASKGVLLKFQWGHFLDVKAIFVHVTDVQDCVDYTIANFWAAMTTTDCRMML